MPGLQITEKDFLIVMYAQIISDHMGTMNPTLHMELAEKIYKGTLEHAIKSSKKL